MTYQESLYETGLVQRLPRKRRASVQAPERRETNSAHWTRYSSTPCGFRWTNFRTAISRLYGTAHVPKNFQASAMAFCLLGTFFWLIQRKKIARPAPAGKDTAMKKKKRQMSLIVCFDLSWCVPPVARNVQLLLSHHPTTQTVVKLGVIRRSGSGTKPAQERK